MPAVYFDNNGTEHYYFPPINPVPAAPARPTAPQAPVSPVSAAQVKTLTGVVNTDLARYRADLSTLGVDQSNLQQQQRRPQGWNNIKEAGDPGFATTAQDQLTVDQQQAVVNHDKANLATAKQKLAAVQRVKPVAGHFKPQGDPAVTVSNPVTKAVKPGVTTAQRQGSKGQARVNADQAALATTNAQITALANDPDLNRGSIQRAMALGRQWQREEQQLRQDRASLNAQKPTITANTAAGNVVLYGQQISSDATWLYQHHIINSKGQLIHPQSDLSAQQSSEYNKYIATIATYNKYYGQLQWYVSDTKQYGAIGVNAESHVNAELASLGLQYLAWPKAIPVGQAAAGLGKDITWSKQADADWGASVSLVNFNAAAAAAKKSPTLTNLTALAQAQGLLDQANGYAGKLYFGGLVSQDEGAVVKADAALRKAQTSWSTHPTASNANAVYRIELQVNAALAQLENDRQSLQIAQGTFYQGTAEILSSPTAGSLAVSQQQFEKDLGQVQYDQAHHEAVSPSLTRDLNIALTTLTQDETNPGELTTLQLEKYTGELSTQQAYWVGVDLSPGELPGAGVARGSSTQAKDLRSWLSTQQEVSQFEYALSSFNMVEPTNIVAGFQTQSPAWQQEWDGYAKTHHVTLADPTTAEAVEGLAPGQRVNVAQSLAELQAELKAEKRMLADRSLLQQGWDAVIGHHSGTETFVEGQIAKLEKLITEGKGKHALDVDTYNQDYLTIVGSQSSQYDALSTPQFQDQQNWSQVQGYVVGGVMMVGATAITIGSLGTLSPVGAAMMGGAAAYTAKEAFDSAQNYVTISEGGQAQDNPDVGLMTLMTNNYFHGGITGGEVIQGFVNAGENAVTAFGSSAAAATGAWAWEAAAARFLPSVLGIEGLQVAPEDEAAQVVTDIAKQNVKQSLAVRLLAGAAQMTGIQVINSGANLITTGMQLTYGRATGQLTGEQASQQWGQAVLGALFNVATAPLVGAVTAGVSNKLFWLKPPVDFGINTALVAGTNYASGQRGMTAADWFQVAFNTLLMAPAWLPEVENPNTERQPAPSSSGFGRTFYDSSFEGWLRGVAAKAAAAKQQWAESHTLGAAANPNLTPDPRSPTPEDIAAVRAILQADRTVPSLPPDRIEQIQTALDNFIGPRSAATARRLTPEEIAAVEASFNRFVAEPVAAVSPCAGGGQCSLTPPNATPPSPTPVVSGLPRISLPTAGAPVSLDPVRVATSEAVARFFARRGDPSAAGGPPSSSPGASSSTPSASPPAIPTPAPATSTPPDVETIPTVRRGLADLNGDPYLTGSRIAALLTSLTARFNPAKAGYSADESGQLATDLKNLPRRERAAIVRALRALPDDDHQAIQTLLAELTPTLEHAFQGVDTSVRTSLVAQIGALSADDRARVLTNLNSFPWGTTEAETFIHFLTGAPVHYDAVLKARLGIFLLSFPDAARGEAMRLVTDLVKLENDSRANPLSPAQTEEQRRLLNSLIDLAGDNNVPVGVTRFVEAPPASSLQAVLQSMPLGHIREFASRSSYDAAARSLVTLIDGVAGSSDPNLRLVIETGALGLDEHGNVRPSIYGGIEGTVLFARALRSALALVPDFNQVDLDVTVVTDGLNKPVVEAVMGALKVDGIKVLEAPGSEEARTALLERLKPNAVLSFGQSEARGGTGSLIGPAVKLSLPTFAIGDYTDESTVSKPHRGQESNGRLVRGHRCWSLRSTRSERVGGRPRTQRNLP